jgi:hypothetical protein
MKTLEILSKRIVVFICVSIVVMGCTSAQQTRQIGVIPVMKVTNLDKNLENPMRLDILKIDIKVIGQIAITTLDMTYYNNNSRIMEGEFIFPLGEGQTVSRFALDINGVLREGVVVEKEQGRKTFEAIVRRGADPGLLEMTEGNNFRSRVYPLPAKGFRRVVLSFEQELTDKGRSDLYLLPLKINEAIGKFSIHAEVIKTQVLLDDENELSNLSFKQWNDSYVANFEKDNYIPNKQIALSFPHLNDSAKIFTAFKNNNADTSYFYLTIRPRLFEQSKSSPKQMTLLWDNSSSAKDRNIEKDLAMLGAYIQKICNLNIELVPFNIKTGKVELFEITNGNWDKLKLTLTKMVPDGGTSFGNIDFTKFRSDEVWLFSDGMSNFGKSEPHFANIPVNTINSSLTANHSFLTYLAQRSGGVYINLNKLTNAEALSQLNNSNYHFISAQIENGKVSDVYPSMPCQFINSFSIAGTMVGKSASLILNFGFGNTVMYSKKIIVDANNSFEPDLIRRLWAEKKISELNLNNEKNKDEISRTGKEFGIVTQNTSLIVLENLHDYLQYQIMPPKEMQKEYFNQIYDSEKEASNKIQKHIDYVINLSNEQSKWWNTKYPIAPVPPDKPVKMNRPGNARAARFSAPVVVSDENAVEAVQEEPAFFMLADASPQTQADITTNLSAKQTKSEPKADIQINAWDPQTPYLKVLEYAPKRDAYHTYLKLKNEYGSTPAFYLDVCDFFAKMGKKDTAVQILSNLAELQLESPQLLRNLGNKLLDLNFNGKAVLVFEKVLKLRGEEPQSFRDLGLAYEANGDSQLALNSLYEVVKKEWDGRFPAIELIVLNEINNIISLHPNLDYSFIDKRLIKKEPVNIRVVLTWDTDNCDMDLWVTDPAGEKCFYQNKLTRLGGKISNDFTRGFGPEEFIIKKAVNGEFKVQSNYYGTRSQSLLAPVNLHLTFITNFGQPNQKKQEVTIRLESQKDIIDVGNFSFKKELEK